MSAATDHQGLVIDRTTLGGSSVRIDSIEKWHARLVPPPEHTDLAGKCYMSLSFILLLAQCDEGSAQFFPLLLLTLEQMRPIGIPLAANSVGRALTTGASSYTAVSRRAGRSFHHKIGGTNRTTYSHAL